MVEDLSDDDLSNSVLLTKVKTPDSANLEAAELEEEIAELSTFLTSLKSHAAERKLRHQKELTALGARIEKDKARYAESVEKEVAEQQAEIQGLLAEQEEELQWASVQQQRINADSSNWTQLTADLPALADDLEQSKLQIQVTRARSEQQELSVLQKTQTRDEKMRQSANLQFRQLQLDVERARLMDVGAAEKQQKQQHRDLMSECAQSRDLLAQIHENLIQKLGAESTKREKWFASHLEMVRRQLEKEQERHESEVKSAKK